MTGEGQKSETRQNAEAQRIGQAMLDLSARLPEGRIDIGGQMAEAELYVSYEAGDCQWEIEFCALDPKRNVTMRGSDLDALVCRVLERDRRMAPGV